ncbi:MAG TPA: hypothetical protein VHT71_01765 [Methylomirabilota bacterium]|jgi:hypothetical protein|nr:hypothetical protein [Methylomirabilota bacterium]
MSWPLRAHARDVVVAAPPDVVLLHGVAVLRRLGARITRYDGDEGTAEARLRRFTRPALIRLRAEASGDTVTRLRVESDALAWAPMFRRFRIDLLRLEQVSS